MGSLRVIVLDTHSLIWWLNGDEHLSSPAQDAIDGALHAATPILVSAISAWEIAMLVERNRIALAMDLDEWLAAVESVEGVSIVPVTQQVAVHSARLPGEFHKDPADRMIVALARERNALLVTADQRI
ncbi:MAG: type II toxin-antitoxin system VapC family toxin, partial [Pseudomonas sp.]